MKRRNFIHGAGMLVASMAASRGHAHSPADFDAMIPRFALPDDLVPREVLMAEDLPPFEIHVDPRWFALYWTLPERRALRFSVGIGRPGLYHAGVFSVGDKRPWPRWTPTPEMIARNPEAYEKYAGGMPGGPENPLGARALYLFDTDGRDTYLRIHGTNDPTTIGHRVSNGCARLTNDQIIDLYNLVPIGTRVVLHPAAA